MASDPEASLRALQDALAVSPDNLPLLLHLAQLLGELERYDEAERWLKRALTLAPEGDDRARLALGHGYLAQGKVSHAAVLAELCVQRADAPAEAHLLLARVRMAEKDPGGAREAFERALELDPGLAGHELARRLGFSARPSGAGGSGPAAASLGARPTDDDEDDDGPRSEVDDESLALPNEPEGGPLRSDEMDVERPRIRFADVGGMEDVKEEIAMKVIQPLAHPELFQAYGKKVGGGVLLYGPPGCGKTHLARATAGEVQASFLSIGIHDVLDMWIGKSEQNLHALFQEARRRAPCVLFFDEVDALGAKRGELRGASRQVVNQFLSELDGAAASNEGVLVLGATNAPWHLDSAFRRPGRFDRMIFVPPPDAPARESILEVLLRERPTGKVKLKDLAKRTERFSGADLQGVVDRAVEAKLREALKRGQPTPIETSDLLAVIKKVQPTTREWFETARNHVLFANQSGLYDDVARYLGLEG